MISPKTAFDSLVEGSHGAPRQLLGYHANKKGVLIRTFQPTCSTIYLERPGHTPQPMERVHPDGIFEIALPDADVFPYSFRCLHMGGQESVRQDPYAFPLQIEDTDLYLFGEGTHYRTYLRMGAHVMTLRGVKGVHFAVWAPNAVRVSVIGNFNMWDGRVYPMESRGDSGLWEIFIPGLGSGELYKYEIKGRDGFLALKSDPYAFAAEMRPRTASRVWQHGEYQWHDQHWMEMRKSTDHHAAPLSVYEVHAGSWRRVPDEGNRFLTYRELAHELIPYVKNLGFTHIELMPVSEHPFDGSWGYQAIGYYAPTSRFGSPDDFKYFVDQCHQAGLGVLIDWVPAHFPKDDHGLAYFDGTHLYEHADPRKGEHRDWGTLIFNYGRNEVRSFLLSNAVFWAEMYHIDGIRVDAVASMLYLDYSRNDGEWIPNEYGGRENLEAVSFLKRFNEIMHAEFPGIMTFAEESTSWPSVSRPTYLGGLGFGYKWNMGWMNDTLEFFAKDPVHRRYHHGDLTFSLIYAFTENFILPFSHDEVVHGKGSMLGKMPGDDWQKFANLRLLLALMYAHPGKKLLFMGAEFGQWQEWNHANSLDWHLLQYAPHLGLMQFVRDLNATYARYPALYEVDFDWQGFQWIELHDSDQSILSFIRRGRHPEDEIVAAFNLTPVPRSDYRLGVPQPGGYREVLNSDSEHYGGSNMGNSGEIHSELQPWQGQPHSVRITLPPLGAILLRPFSATSFDNPTS